MAQPAAPARAKSRRAQSPRRNEVDITAPGADAFRHHPLHTMKHTLITLITGITCALPLNAQDKPDAPRDHERREAAGKEAATREGAEREFAAAKEKIDQRMKAAREEAAELEKAGNKDAAEAKRKEAEQQRNAALNELRQHMRGRRQGEVRRDGEPRREGEPRRPEGQRRDGDGRRHDGPPRHELENKLRHVEQAIGHLREAEMPEPAEHLNQVANRLRGALRGEGDGPRREEGHRQQARREDGRRQEGPQDQPLGDIEALRREIQELRQAVRQLAEKQGR